MISSCTGALVWRTRSRVAGLYCLLMQQNLLASAADRTRGAGRLAFWLAWLHSQSGCRFTRLANRIRAGG
jgi:hypothetical protein